MKHLDRLFSPHDKETKVRVILGAILLAPFFVFLWFDRAPVSAHQQVSYDTFVIGEKPYPQIPKGIEISTLNPVKASPYELSTVRPHKPAKSIKKLPVKKVPVVAPKPVQPPPVSSGCGDNEYAHFIYMHESGCRTDAVNALGCAGIGQACPGSKLPCSLYDYTCQNVYFTNYAISTYGSWQGAYNAWNSRGWW